MVDGAPSHMDFDGEGADRVRYCPICDGYEAIDKRIGVMGPLEAAKIKAKFLLTYSPDVTVVATDAATANDCDPDIATIGPPARIEARSSGVTVTTSDGAEHDFDLLYPAMGCTVRSELARSLGADCGDDVGTLATDLHQQTTVRSLYAAGDVVTDLHQLSVAIGHAAVAATHIHRELPPNPRKPKSR